MNLLNAVTQLFKLLDDAILGSKGQGSQHIQMKFSSYFSLSPADWIGFQMFDDEGKKQPCTFTLGSRGIKYQI